MNGCLRWKDLLLLRTIKHCGGSGMFTVSRILIFTHPGSRIQKQPTKERGEKKICCHNFLCSHKFHNISHYFSFDVLKKKIWANFQRIIGLFIQKIVNKLSKIGIWDPGSGKNLFRIPDPGVQKAPDPRSGSATLLLRAIRWLTKCS
jgi:hypothetical protein